jgi:hypothetical protein
MSRLVLAVVVVSSVGCTVDVSIEGKQCPCVDGFVCDPALDQCVRQTCEPKVTVADFEAAWATSNTIRWTWTPQGEPDDLLRYELRLAETRQALATSDARIYSADDNPELAGYLVPIVGGVVDATWSDDLEPGMSYVAQLRAVDDELCEYGSDVAAEATLPALPSTITLFRDELPPDAELAPAAITVTPDGSGSGAHLAYSALTDDECNPDVPDPEDVRAVCGQPLRLRRLDRSIVRDPGQPAGGGLEESSLASAFLEMKVSNVAPVDSYYSVMWLRFGDCFSEDLLFRWDGFAFRSDDAYVTLQVPLRILENGDGPLTFDPIDTNGSGQTLCGVAIGAGWHKTSEVRVDDIVIRY